MVSVVVVVMVVLSEVVVDDGGVTSLVEVGGTVLLSGVDVVLGRAAPTPTQ
jgi:hypothetical protein